MTWWARVKALFAEAEASTPQAPAVHEPLTRHRDAGEDYARWRDGLVRRRLTDWLADQYRLFLTAGSARTDEAIDFLDTPSAKGFVVHFGDTQYTLAEAELFQLFLRERVLARGYRTQAADTRVYSRGQQTERTDRYYLKPRPAWSHPDGPDAPMDGHTAGQFDQGFGNVLVELVVRNDRPHQLRFSATIYHDRVYKEARGFGALMDAVLGSD